MNITIVIIIFLAFMGGAFIAYLLRPKGNTDDTGLKLILQHTDMSADRRLGDEKLL